MIKHLTIILAVVLCLGAAPLYAQESHPSQPIEIIILNSRQAPVPGVRVQITPLAGELQDAIEPTNAQGRTTINWLPQTVQDETQSSDTLLRYVTSFAWQVEQSGFLKESGIIGRQSTERHVQSEELVSLDAAPIFPKVQKTINLYAPPELFAPGFDQAELKQWCASFYENNYELARALGTPFNWPPFALELDDTLVINLQYAESGWAGTAEAGLLQRATLNTYLPWWLLLSENIEKLPLIVNIKLVFVSSKDINPLDAHAWSEDVVLSARFPVSALSQIGLGHCLSLLAARYPLQLNTDEPANEQVSSHRENRPAPAN